MFRGSGIKIIFLLLALPMLFGFALHNRVKNAEITSGQPNTHAIAPAVPSEPTVFHPSPPAISSEPTAATAATPGPLPTTQAAAPTASQTAQTGLEEEPVIPQTAAIDPDLSPTPPALEAAALDLLEWKQWPVVPTVSEDMREVYRRGLAQGNNPHAFSILGDCQSLPEVFMGVFDANPALVAQLPDPWQETVAQFEGSFNRWSPTVKDGTTEGALLWGLWNDNKEKQCGPGESPLDCELRVHRPSIVFVHVGTHWEARNRHYLTIILNKILEQGAVPILVTKADNRELDERVNENYAALAAEYGIPLWNFWASVQNLPDRGIEPDSDMYLSPAGLEIHRTGSIQVLDAVWRAVR